ncbi:hypothetical protein GCM10010353_47190 [Streptomyces chryseus]|nr:hypothetical protein GCM10010353_47190 [Streptomyces chryseus]
MQYMGGKERQARYVVEQLRKHGAGCTRYLEPFIGGVSIFARMAPDFPGAAAGADVHPDLSLMWAAVIDGWEPPKVVTREEYAALRNAEPSALRGFVGFGLSFGGKWFGGYASNNRGDDFCGAARRGVLRKAAGMVGQRVTNADYRTFNPGAGTLVYCDPPYAGTTGYAGGLFDHDEFWHTVQRWADAGAVVLVSEYAAPQWAESVWAREAVKSLRKDSNTLPATEQIFRIPADAPLPAVA